MGYIEHKSIEQGIAAQQRLSGLQHLANGQALAGLASIGYGYLGYNGRRYDPEHYVIDQMKAEVKDYLKDWNK